MSAPTPPSTTTMIVPAKPRSLLSRALGNRPLIVGSLIILVLLACSSALPALLQVEPYEVDPVNRLHGPSAEHIFGTDAFGRDVFARVAAGAFTSLSLGFSVAVISGVLGTLIGVLAGYFSTLDHLLMRVADGMMSIPSVLLAVAISAALGPSKENLIIALTIVFTPTIARLVRSRAFSVKSETFVEASEAQGAKPSHVILKHIVPNVLSVLVVQATFIFADSIITEAALSFLGAGVPPPAPSWGNILSEGKAVITQSPWMVIFVSASLVTTVIGLNLLGDGLRDLVDPRSGSGRSRRRTPRFRGPFAGFGASRKDLA